MQKNSKIFNLCDTTHFSIAKGIGIIIVVLVHLTNGYLNFPWLSPVAGGGVAIFLICSGYGLYESFKKKAFTSYWSNKFVKIWVPSFIQVTVVALVGMIGFKAWLTNNPLFLYGWYLQVLFFDYALFWVLYKFVKNKNLCLFLLFVISVVVFFLTKSQLYAEQFLCFPIGVAFSQLNLKKFVSEFSAGKIVVVFSALISVMAGVWLLRNNFSNYILSNAVWHIIKTAFAIIVLYAVYIFRKIPLLKLFIPFGSMSYAIYLLNNYTLTFLHNREINLLNVVLALVITFGLSFIYSRICDLIYKKYVALKKKDVK